VAFVQPPSSLVYSVSAIQEPKEEGEEAKVILAPTWITAQSSAAAKVKAIRLIEEDFDADRTHFNYWVQSQAL